MPRHDGSAARCLVGRHLNRGCLCHCPHADETTTVHPAVIVYKDIEGEIINVTADDEYTTAVCPGPR